MAVDFFLEIDGVEGESADAGHADQIDVLSWSWGMSQTGSMHMGRGGGSGKVNVSDITIVKRIDKSTPNLMKSCTSGKHFEFATLTCRKATGGEQLEYLVLSLKDVLISSISSGGGGGEEFLTETVTLNFAAFDYAYTPQNEKGEGEPEVKHGYHIAENREL